MIKKGVIFLIFFLLFNIFSRITYAKESEKYMNTEKFITIVNPVRISKYTKTPEKSLNSEYSAIKTYSFPATWLLTYDALNNKKVVDELKKMDKSQEFGIFLEITSGFATEVGVEYHDSGFWHHANSVFLSGYTQEERILLIDKVFAKYKEIFGEYPKSIGGWGTDGYSLSYIKNKYGVIANLVCADQFLTDGYKIWGQPWQMPYYPNKNYSAVPASNFQNKLDLVNIQWASRDPLNGYNSSLYSTQDYLVTGKNLNIDYYKKIIDLYLNTGSFGQVTLGLEADLDSESYKGEFQRQMSLIKNYVDEGVEILTMSEFYNRYQKKYPNISPSTNITSKDLLESRNEAHWFSNPYYRLHYLLDTNSNTIQIKDFRVYGDNLIDPYFKSPNSEFKLSINISPLIDSMQNPTDVWVLPKGSEIFSEDKNVILKGKNIKIPDRIKNNTLIDLIISTNEVKITFKELNFDTDEGNIMKGLSSEAQHFFKIKKSVLQLLIGHGWDYFNKMSYLVPQGEIYALNYLKSLPPGKVMVFDNECLQCSWHTKNKPIVFANLRNYVKKYSNHPIEYNSSVFNAKTIEVAQKEFKKVNAKYVYLVKFEEYIEKLPFSPGDLKITKIYSNANAEVWEVE